MLFYLLPLRKERDYVLTCVCLFVHFLFVCLQDYVKVINGFLTKFSEGWGVAQRTISITVWWQSGS